MKAIVVPEFGGPDVLSYQEVPDPVPGEGEVLIRVEAASINYADVLLRVGRYHQGAPPPTVPGLDVAGTIVALGSGVGGLTVGQRVAAGLSGGGYAELAVASASLVWPLPAAVDTETGAAFPIAGLTAYNTLTLAGRLAEGETVVVHSAAGGVGTTASQIARVLGAGQVIGTVGDRAKEAAAREAGCDEVVVRGEEDFAARVNELTGGAGADLILDSIAGETMARGLDCLAPFGRLVAFGISSGEAGQALSTQLHPLNRAVVGYSSGHYRRFRPEALRAPAEAVLGMLADGRLRLVIGARFPLAEAAKAHELIESRASIGKILLIP